MPTYDYVCDACEHQFELFQSITAEPEKKCPECGKKKLRRLIGPGAAIVFKGSGFHSTDYRSPSYKKAVEAEKNGSGSKESGKDKAAVAPAAEKPAKSAKHKGGHGPAK